VHIVDQAVDDTGTDSEHANLLSSSDVNDV
jgi:hypothetical protein